MIHFFLKGVIFMAFDGLLLHNIVNLTKDLCPCKISKIQNRSDEEVVFLLHTRNKPNPRLIINVHSNTNRMFLTTSIIDTNQNPSNFVMVLRKQINNGIIESIDQMAWDRIAKIAMQTRNELGDIIHIALYAELMGKYANLVLVDENGIIIDALKRIPVYENSKRMIHPGAKYVLPSQPEKQDPTKVTRLDMESSLVGQVYGFSPILSKEFFYRMHQGQTFQDIIDECLTSKHLYVYPKDYHCLPLLHLSQEAKVFELMDGLLHVHSQTESKTRIKEACGDVFRIVNQEYNKLSKKLPKLQESYSNSLDYKKYQEYGDLLFAYQNTIKKEKTVILNSFETGDPVKIEIDMRYDIKTNANKYYQKYHKLKRSQDILLKQIEECKEDIAYFAQLKEQLNYCSMSDAMEIREELIKNRYLFQKKHSPANKKKKAPHVLHLQMEDADIYVGKNNIQNNYITHHLSRKEDIWFHVKDYHGSHVLIKTQNLDEQKIRLCASLAAYFSKGKESSSVPVDYCPISQIKKVPGSKIGFVTMKHYKTIYIDPDQEEIEKTIQTYEKRA